MGGGGGGGESPDNEGAHKLEITEGGRGERKFTNHIAYYKIRKLYHHYFDFVTVIDT